MMKRLIGAPAALAMLIWTCPAARAELIGELRRDRDRVINFDYATVEKSLEIFPQRGIDIAPENQATSSRFCPNCTVCSSPSPEALKDRPRYLAVPFHRVIRLTLRMKVNKTGGYRC